MITENEILVQYDENFNCSRIYHKCNSQGFNFSYLNFWYKTKKKSRSLVCPKCKFIIKKSFLDLLNFLDLITLRTDYGYCFRPGVWHPTCGFAAFSDELILKNSLKLRIWEV